MMTRGKQEKHDAHKKKHALLSAAFPQGIRCQKCFAYGHWSYECTKDKGKNSDQPSRTEKMKPSLKATKGGCRNGSCPIKKNQKKESACKDCSDSSSNEQNSSNCSTTSSEDWGSSSPSDSESESFDSGSSSCSGSDCP